MYCLTYGVDLRIPVEAKDWSLLQSIQTGSGAHTVSKLMSACGFSSRSKAETWH